LSTCALDASAADVQVGGWRRIAETLIGRCEMSQSAKSMVVVAVILVAVAVWVALATYNLFGRGAEASDGAVSSVAGPPPKGFVPFVSAYDFPTATPTPTVTPTPSPTPLPSGVNVLPNFDAHVYTDPDGYEHLAIRGQVENTSGSSVMLVRVSVDVINTTGQVVDTIESYTALDVVHNNERACFHLDGYVPQNYSHFEWNAPGYYATGEIRPDLVVTDFDLWIIDISPWPPNYVFEYAVKGHVRNDEAVAVHGVDAIVTVLEDDLVVGCIDFSTVEPPTIFPGESAEFTSRDLVYIGPSFPPPERTHIVQATGYIP
jgi:hypothetical protein